jgi:hypothetical protein
MLLFSPVLTMSQMIKAGSGFSHSLVKDKTGNVCSHRGYSVDLGIDYLESRYFNMITVI